MRRGSDRHEHVLKMQAPLDREGVALLKKIDKKMSKSEAALLKYTKDHIVAIREGYQSTNYLLPAREQYDADKTAKEIVESYEEYSTSATQKALRIVKRKGEYILTVKSLVEALGLKSHDRNEERRIQEIILSATADNLGAEIIRCRKLFATYAKQYYADNYHANISLAKLTVTAGAKYRAACKLKPHHDDCKRTKAMLLALIPIKQRRDENTRLTVSELKEILGNRREIAKEVGTTRARVRNPTKIKRSADQKARVRPTSKDDIQHSDKSKIISDRMKRHREKIHNSFLSKTELHDKQQSIKNSTSGRAELREILNARIMSRA